MITLLIVADDFTGALDTGVQLASCGAHTRVVTDPAFSFGGASEAEVLVIDAETRHLPPAQAAAVVEKIVRQAVAQKVPYIYKETDSALRGNIGAELGALLRASGEQALPFLPAYPQIGRCTREGVHYIDGQPVAQSVFGIDPFEPVRHSRVADLIGAQCGVPVHCVGADAPAPAGQGIYVYDAACLEDLERAGRTLAAAGRLHISAGCAGFGAVLPGLLGLCRPDARPRPKLDPRLLVVCGSVNPITVAQLDAAERAGFARLRLTPRQKLQPGPGHFAADRRGYPAAKYALRRRPGAGAGVRAGKRGGAGAVHLQRLYPAYHHQVRRVWAAEPAHRPGRAAGRTGRLTTTRPTAAGGFGAAQWLHDRLDERTMER